MRLHSNTRVRGDVTLVELLAVNDADDPRRVQVENALDGAVLHPLRQGQPEAGWTGCGYEGVVPANGRLALGYACRAAPADPPATIADTATATETTEETDPAAVMSALGDPRPPRDAVPGGR